MSLTTEAQGRAASPSIRGYVYQFDRTVIEILRASESTVITVEGCEDIDINDNISPESVQCKYLASARYSLAGLRNIVIPMLKAFANGRRWQYRLYAYYSEASRAPSNLTLPELKECLTEVKRKSAQTVKHYQSYPEEVLEDFLQHFTITTGASFTQQRQEVIDALCENIPASRSDAVDLHYNNAIACILDLAINPAENDRRTTKKDFLLRINKRPMLYSRWHEEIIGRTRIIKMIQKRLRDTDALRPKNRRTLVLDAQNSAHEGTSGQLAHLIEKLATEHYGQGHLTSARPWTVVIEGNQEDVRAIKTHLIDKEIAFNDGYETISFSAPIFESPPMIKTTKSGSKITRVSYHIRVVSSETYLKYVHQLTDPTVILSFGRSSPAHYSMNTAPYEFHIRTADLEEMVTLMGKGR